MLVAGTFDTKGRELRFMADRLKALKIPVKTARPFDLGKTVERRRAGTAGGGACIAAGLRAVMSGDRGGSVAAMAEAFARWIAQEPKIGGIISAGGSGGTTLATAGMRVLPVGMPKIMVSTVAAGDVGNYVGGADIMMFHSVADVQGLNSITEAVLSQRGARHGRHGGAAADGRAVGSQAQTGAAGDRHHHVRRDHAGGAGGRRNGWRPTTTAWSSTPPALAAGRWRTSAIPRLLSGFIDLDHHGSGRHDRRRRVPGDRGPASARRSAPACPMSALVGALDMVNFGPRETVPEKFRSRKSRHPQSPMLTLMRTTRDENRAFGEWIGERLNRDERAGAVPAAGRRRRRCSTRRRQPFHDPEADNALLEAIERTVRVTPMRQVAAGEGQHQRCGFSSRRRSRRSRTDHAEDAEEGVMGSRRCGTHCWGIETLRPVQHLIRPRQLVTSLPQGGEGQRRPPLAPANRKRRRLAGGRRETAISPFCGRRCPSEAADEGCDGAHRQRQHIRRQTPIFTDN